MSKEFKNKLNELRQQAAPDAGQGATAAPAKRGRGRPRKNPEKPPAAAADAGAGSEKTAGGAQPAYADPAIKEKTIEALAGMVRGIFDFWAGLDGLDDIKLSAPAAESLAEKIYEVLLIEKPDFKLDPRVMAWGGLLLVTYSLVKPRFDVVKKEREKRKKQTPAPERPTKPANVIPLAGNGAAAEVVNAPAEERNTIA